MSPAPIRNPEPIYARPIQPPKNNQRRNQKKKRRNQGAQPARNAQRLDTSVLNGFEKIIAGNIRPRGRTEEASCRPSRRTLLIIIGILAAVIFGTIIFGAAITAAFRPVPVPTIVDHLRGKRDSEGLLNVVTAPRTDHTTPHHITHH